MVVMVVLGLRLLAFAVEWIQLVADVISSLRAAKFAVLQNTDLC